MTDFLQSLEGNWEGTTTTWFEPGDGFQDPWTVSFRLLQGGNFVLQEHTSQVQGKPQAGWALIGRDHQEGNYTVALADSFHTSGSGLLSSRGRVDEAGEMSVLGHYQAGTEQWGWRTTMQVQDGTLTIRAFNISPDGQEYPALHTVLNRRR